MTVALFAEDAAHRALLVPLIQRICGTEGHPFEIAVRNAAGGEGPAVTSLRSYVRDMHRGVDAIPDILVVAVDSNCVGRARRLKQIRAAMKDYYAGQLVAAIPDPYIERWYLADPRAVGRIFEHDEVADLPAYKCGDKRYKRALRDAFLRYDVDPPAGGIEYGEDVVVKMDLQAASALPDFDSFVRDLRSAIRLVARG